MSAFGTKRTCRRCPAMSAFGGKADMAISERDDSARMFPKLDLRADIHQAMRCASPLHCRRRHSRKSVTHHDIRRAAARRFLSRKRRLRRRFMAVDDGLRTHPTADFVETKPKVFITA